MNDIVYKINKEEGVVVCIITGNGEVALNRLDKYVPHYSWNYGEVMIKDTYIGVAKCSPEDEWDEEKGKKLALVRAKRKRSKDINKTLYHVIEVMEREIYDLNMYGIHKLPSEDEILS